MANVDTSVPGPIALYPLTAFDRLFERTTFVTGWLLEGTIDTDAFAAAVGRVTSKWRMLSGRLESYIVGTETKWRLRIPLGPLPPDYPTFALTTSVSDKPLSHYVKLPLSQVSPSLPSSVFLHSSAPRQYVGWESTTHPLTCWNILTFPADANGGVAYTCIGFGRCHGIFDGGGASMVMKAVIAEVKGQEWDVPPPPNEGWNVNAVDQLLARESLTIRGEVTDVQPAYTPLSIPGFLKLIAWHVRERYWRGANKVIIHLPKVVLDDLVDEVRSALQEEGKQAEVVSSGDVLVAWMFKTIFSTTPNKALKVHCTNLCNFRPLLAPKAKEIMSYPHNAFIPLPYPTFTAGELQSLPLPALTHMLTASRHSISIQHVVSAYDACQNPCFPTPPGTDETITVSNVSASRILETDWSSLGAGRTLSGYRYQATPTDVLFTNAIYIAGRLADGTVVLDVAVNKARLNLLLEDIRRREEKVGKKANGKP